MVVGVRDRVQSGAVPLAASPNPLVANSRAPRHSRANVDGIQFQCSRELWMRWGPRRDSQFRPAPADCRRCLKPGVDTMPLLNRGWCGVVVCAVLQWANAGWDETNKCSSTNRSRGEVRQLNSRPNKQDGAQCRQLSRPPSCFLSVAGEMDAGLTTTLFCGGQTDGIAGASFRAQPTGGLVDGENK